MRKFLLPILLLLSLSGLAQTLQVNPIFKTFSPQPTITDSLFVTWTGKPDGYSKFYTQHWINGLGAGYFKISNNLFESTNFPQLRTNIGLGTGSDVTFKTLSFTALFHNSSPATEFLTLDGSGRITSRLISEVLSDIGAEAVTNKTATASSNTTTYPNWSGLSILNALNVKYTDTAVALGNYIPKYVNSIIPSQKSFQATQTFFGNITTEPANGFNGKAVVYNDKNGWTNLEIDNPNSGNGTNARAGLVIRGSRRPDIDGGTNHRYLQLTLEDTLFDKTVRDKVVLAAGGAVTNGIMIYADAGGTNAGILLSTTKPDSVYNGLIKYNPDLYIPGGPIKGSDAYKALGIGMGTYKPNITGMEKAITIVTDSVSNLNGTKGIALELVNAKATTSGVTVASIIGYADTLSNAKITRIDMVTAGTTKNTGKTIISNYNAGVKTVALTLLPNGTIAPGATAVALSTDSLYASHGGILGKEPASGLTAGTATALATARTISITGDLSYTSPSFDGSANITAAGTLATVNSNTGSFGSSTAIPTITVNGKGLITSVSTNAVIAPAGTLTGTALPVGITSAPGLTSVSGGTFGTNAFNSIAYLPIAAGSGNPLSNAVFTAGSSVTSSASQTNISAYTSNGLRINGNGSAASQDAISYLGFGSTAGGAAISFRRGTGYDTYIDWSTNNTSTQGAITRQATLDNLGNFSLLNGAYSGLATNLTGTASGLNVGGTANNITAYTINQNLGTSNSPTFGGGTYTGDLTIYRSGSPTVSVLFMNQAQTAYLENTSSGFSFNGGSLTASAFVTSGGTAAKVVLGDGTLGVYNGALLHGNSTTTGTATSAVTVTIGSTMANTNYFVTITPQDLLTAVNYYVSAKTTTTFTITFVTALTGSINFDWGVTP